MSVRTELVREHLVSMILGSALDRGTAGIPERAAAEMEDAIEAVADPGLRESATDDARGLATDTARIGYVCREVELEQFEPARSDQERIRELLESVDRRASHAGAVRAARDLARAEPDGRPDPDGATASWRVPGPGGHVRHYVAVEAADRIRRRAGVGAAAIPLPAAELKRCWLFGFLLRCFERPTASS